LFPGRPHHRAPSPDMQMLAKTLGAVAALLAVSTSLLGCGGGGTPCESSFRQAEAEHMRMMVEFRNCSFIDADPEQWTECQCNLLRGMVEVSQRFLDSCDDEALTPVFDQLIEGHRVQMQVLGCDDPMFVAPVAQRLRHSHASSVVARSVTDVGPYVDTIQASSLLSSNATTTTAPPGNLDCNGDIHSASAGFGGILSMLAGLLPFLMVLVISAVTLAFLACRRQAPSEVELADTVADHSGSA